MYQVIENPKVMTEEEIDKEFDGKWVYIVKANVTRHGEILSGTPVVVADSPYEGQENGIYDQYDGPDYVERVDYDMNHYDPFISSMCDKGTVLLTTFAKTNNDKRTVPLIHHGSSVIHIAGRTPSDLPPLPPAPAGLVPMRTPNE